MTTTITSNGSKWAGEQPDSIDDLIGVLANYPLDRVFERYGNFIFESDAEPGMTTIWGNFFNLSHVFNIRTNDTDVIDRLTAAINANQMRPDYLEQPVPLTLAGLKAERLAKAQEMARLSREMRGLQ